MTSHDVEPQLGAESFSCPHCNAVAQQAWFSLFLKPENATDVVVLTLEAAMLLKGEDNGTNESEQFLRQLKDNVLTYEYQNPPRTLKAKLVNLHVSRCYNCKGFALWVRDRLVFPGRAEEGPHIIEIEGHVEEPSADVQEPADVEESTGHVEERVEDFEEAAAILNKFPRGAAALTRICIQKMMPLLKETGKDLDENISSLVRKGLQVEIQQAMDVLQVLGQGPVELTQFNSREEKEAALKLFDSVKAILKRRMLKS